MIYYFSGTGSSRYVAENLGKYLNEECRFIPAETPFEQSLIGDSIGIVCPVYYWGIPSIVLGFIEELPEQLTDRIRRDNIPLWVVLTYGDEAGNAMKVMRKTLASRGLRAIGEWGIQTPNTYVLMPGFDVDSEGLEKKKIASIDSRIKDISENISKGKWESDIHKGPFAGLKTAIVYPWSCRWGVSPGKWHADKNCIGCGRCARTCPVSNIAMIPKKEENGLMPIWGPVCTACCGCYHICPTHAVQYGNVTLKKGQKHFPFPGKS